MTSHSSSTASPAVLARRFQLRALDVTIESATPELDAAAACLVNHADDHEASERHVRFRLMTRDDGWLDVIEDRDATYSLRTLQEALAHVHRRLGILLHAVYERHTFLHAGAVSIDGRLIVIAGHRGAGKTTLLTRLALDGAEFHCDEYVTASADGIARTVPRRLHIKPGAFVCLPQIEQQCRSYPMLVLDGGLLFYPLDLADLGVTWRSRDARPAAIVHLVPAFDEPPTVISIPQIESVRRLMREAQTGDLAFGRQAADVCGLVRGLRCYEVRVGGLRETAEAIRDIARKCLVPR